MPAVSDGPAVRPLGLLRLITRFNGIPPVGLGTPVSVYANMQGGVWAKDCDDFAKGIVDFDSGINAIVADATALPARVRD